ncbi:MAG: DUF302 domain-containing protein [Dehalococcoidia bacterium]|nr:DUF302 domain-containing protein [Dehalococcoidia bacterium]
MSATVEQLAYGLRREVTIPYEAAVSAVKESLKSQGFGVLTEIDVRATMKAKLDVDMDDYVILGACNPPLAHRALSADPEIGMLLPCNVVVRAASAGSVVEAMDPVAAMALVQNEEIAEVAREARERLFRALDMLPSSH